METGFYKKADVTCTPALETILLLPLRLWHNFRNMLNHYMSYMLERDIYISYRKSVRYLYK